MRRPKKISFVAQLVDSKTLDAYSIAETGANEFGVPLFDITTIDMDALAVKAVEEKLIRKHHVLPLFKRGNRLYVAVADPTNLQALDEIKFQTGLTAEPILVEQDRLAKMIEKSLSAQQTSMVDLNDSDLDDLDITGGEEDFGGDSSDLKWTTPRWCASSTRYCSTPSTKGPPTFTLNLTKRSTGYATARTAC